MQILFIDDDPEDYEMFCEAIKEIKCDAHCIYEQDGASALNYLQRSAQVPDYIFLDLHMLVLGGVECLKKIKGDERLKDTPVVVYTSDADFGGADVNTRRFSELGAAYFIPKGSSFQEIIRRLRDFFGSAR